MLVYCGLEYKFPSREGARVWGELLKVHSIRDLRCRFTLPLYHTALQLERMSVVVYI